METEIEFPELTALQEVATKRSDAVLIVDLVGKKVIYSNPRAIKLLGINTNDNLAKISTLLTYVAPADRDYIRNKYLQVSHNPTVSDIEFRIVDPQDKTVWLSAETITLENNRFLYAIIRDITHEKEHENYLVEWGAKKNTLLDTLTHQLNGSLGLLSNLALKADNLKVTSDQAALETFVALMRDTSQHCIKIIDDLIREEHTESPAIRVKFSRVDIVKSVAYIFEEVRKNGDRRFVFESNVPVMFVSTDDFKVLQIINNFASNALKFTRDGAQIKLSVRDTPTSVMISMSDTGIGIPMNLQPLVFEKHTPASRTGLNGERSNGLGLSICKHLALLLGGRIWFESTENVGSTFTLELPKD